MLRPSFDNRVRRRVAAIFAIVAVVLSLAATQRDASAGDPALPFVPPATWRALPMQMLPQTSTNWSRGGAVFNISRFSFGGGLPLDRLASIVRAQSAPSERVISSATVTVCGRPAQRFVIERSNPRAMLTEQIQSSGSTTYFSVYSTPAGKPADPAILSIMTTYCGANAAAISPPPGWRANDFRLVGLWLSTAAQSILAIELDPRNAANMQPDVVLGSALKVPDIQLKVTSGALCGVPALFFTGVAKRHGTVANTFYAELARSSRAAIFLVYSHPSRLSDDPAALRSMMTLCPPAGAPGTGATPLASETPVANESAVPASSESPIPPSASPVASAAPRPHDRRHAKPGQPAATPSAEIAPPATPDASASPDLSPVPAAAASSPPPAASPQRARRGTRPPASPTPVSSAEPGSTSAPSSMPAASLAPSSAPAAPEPSATPAPGTPEPAASTAPPTPDHPTTAPTLAPVPTPSPAASPSDSPFPSTGPPSRL